LALGPSHAPTIAAEQTRFFGAAGVTTIPTATEAPAQAAPRAAEPRPTSRPSAPPPREQPAPAAPPRPPVEENAAQEAEAPLEGGRAVAERAVAEAAPAQADTSLEGGGVVAELAAAEEAAPAAFRRRPSSARYEIRGEVMGGGMKGIVQHGVDSWTGQEIAVKRVECDTACPIRFLEVRGGEQLVVYSEGYAPVHSKPQPFGGELSFDASNEHGARPFEKDSLTGRVVLVRRGGGVSFSQKVTNAYCGGAAGVVIVSNSSEVDIYSVDAPAGSKVCSVMVPRPDGDAMIASCSAGSRGAPTTCQVRTDVGHEVDICRRLPPHPNVIQVLDTWEDGNAAVVVMELCRGGKVQGPLELPQALRLTRQMLAGLRHIHENGVVHRDVKPENMLLTRPPQDPESRLVIIDFSMGSSVPRMTVPCGSPKYLAPEVLLGEYSSKRDVWSVGAVAHELCLRRHPFEGLREEELVERLRTGPALTMEDFSKAARSAGLDVPEVVLDLLRGLLDADPSTRLSAAEALEHPALAEELFGAQGAAPSARCC